MKFVAVVAFVLVLLLGYEALEARWGQRPTAVLDVVLGLLLVAFGVIRFLGKWPT